MKTIDYILINEINNYIKYISDFRYAKDKDEIVTFSQDALNQVRNKFKVDINLFKSHKEKLGSSETFGQTFGRIQVFFLLNDKLLSPYTFYYFKQKNA